MTSLDGSKLEPPRYETRESFRIAGLRKLFTFQQVEEIPQLWGQFATQLEAAAGPIERDSYGISYVSPDANADFGYMAATEIDAPDDLPTGFDLMEIPAARYAVFPHRGHVSRLGETIMTIDREWLPATGHRQPRLEPGSPLYIERYTMGFDPATGLGGMEVWVPIGA
jgi:AraC family transcriptional regulator